MNDRLDIERLRIVHWLKPVNDVAENATSLDVETGFILDTCLRIMKIEMVPTANGDVSRCLQNVTTEIRFGDGAYQFLLEVMTGLRSAIPGETNIFGQFKKAWSQYQQHGHPEHVAAMTPLIYRAINDTRAVRSAHLEGIGGSSYGSLVRRLIEPSSNDRVLFVGAGDLTASMLPFFRNFRAGVWNRSPARLDKSHIGIVFDAEHGSRAARWADHVVLTTPRDTHNDTNWKLWLSDARARTRTVVHLGHRSGLREYWGEDWGPATTHDLEDVFKLRRQQAGHRSARLERARRTCGELARGAAATV